MSGKALIVYGTRFGATASTSEEIAGVLRKAGLDVKVVNLKKEKISDISEYDLVIVGSGIMMGRWTGEPQKFLGKFKEALKEKRLAIFVSSAGMAMLEAEDKRDEIEKTRNQYLNEKYTKYDVHPESVAIFGGIWNYKDRPWWASKVMTSIKQQVEKSGFKETELGLCDTRDWDAIRNWAKGLVS